MCLARVDSKPRRKSGIGYKLVRLKRDGTYVCFDYTPKTGSITYPLNQWVTDPNDGNAQLDFIGGTPYRTGFHISLDVEALRRLGIAGSRVIIKVRFHEVVATSCDRPDPCYGRQVVAREIMNLGEVN